MSKTRREAQVVTTQCGCCRFEFPVSYYPIGETPEDERYAWWWVDSKWREMNLEHEASGCLAVPGTHRQIAIRCVETHDIVESVRVVLRDGRGVPEVGS